MADVRVTVRLSGAMAQRLGSRRTVALAVGATADDLVAELARDAGFEPAELRGLAVVADGGFVPRDRPLTDGQELGVLGPVAGG
jgi:molybdopterin converting factor small subunit